jgi:hypothetical protein
LSGLRQILAKLIFDCLACARYSPNLFLIAWLAPDARQTYFLIIWLAPDTRQTYFLIIWLAPDIRQTYF